MIGAERDVIIVGAGPAGSICAAYLAKAGIDVLLLDKDIFPKSKVCGDMVCEGAAYHMGVLGAIKTLDNMSTCVRNLKLISNSGRETLIPFECYCTPRYGLDSLLAETAVRHGAELRQGCTVTDIITEQGFAAGVKCVFRGEEFNLRSKIVICADGAFSAMAKSIGIMQEKPYGIWTGERAYFKGVKLDRALAKHQYDAYGVFAFSELVGSGYFWILPVERDGVKHGICNVGLIMNGRGVPHGDDMQALFSKWVQSSRKISVMFQNAQRIGPWQGGRINDISQESRRAGNGFMMIGDAASLIMPLRHDGLSVAADSAKAAADAASAAIRDNDFSEKRLMLEYDKAFKSMSNEKIAEELKRSRLLMESMHDPNVMDRTIDLLDKDPVFRRKHLK